MHNQKILWLALTWLTAIILALYFHYYLGIEIVYTHFIYFALAVTAIYAHRYLMPVAVFLGGLHVLLGYLSVGAVTGTTFARALIALVVAMIIYKLVDSLYSRENEMQETLSKLQLLMENVTDVTWILNLETRRWEYMSPSMERLTGYTMEEIMSQPVKQILTEESYPVIVEKLAERINHFLVDPDAGNMYKDKIEHTRKDGSTVWVEFVSKYMKNNRGDLILLGITRDISDRYQMEQKLQYNNEIMQSLFENSPNLMSFIDKDGRYTMVSHTLARTFGFSPEEFSGKHLMEVMPPELASKYSEHISTILKTQETFASVELLPTKDGYRAFEVWGFPLRREEGQIKLIGSIGMEITERRQAEEKIRQQNLEIVALTNNVSDLIARFDKDLRYVYTNQKTKTERLIGKTNRELGMPEPNLTIWEGAIRAAFNSKCEQTFETSNFGPRGLRYYHSVITPEFDEKGEVATVISVSRDITKLKELQLALNLEKQNLYTTLESIGDGVISTDNQGRITLLNKVAEKLTGWNRDEAQGLPFEEVFHIVDEFTGERRENPIEQVLRSRNTIELSNHTLLVSKQGMRIPVEDTAAPIIDEDGRVLGVVLVFRDFSDKREKQKEIVYLSYHDQLTGLYNRRFFEEEIRRLDTERNLPITLIMADVNGLKLTNDAFGHGVGDQLLQKAAEVIKRECRADDIIARIGGDEFCILLPQTGSQEASGVVKRIRSAVAQEKVGNTILSISFGWDTKLKSEQSMDEVFKTAEDEMYRHKLSESSSMRNQTIRVIVEALYTKHVREERHSYAVSKLCEEIGAALNLSQETIRELRTSGLMHDIGKVTLDERVLTKAEPLTDSEWVDIKRHVETGYRILSSVNELAQIAEYVLAHHERWDGQGYPKGLKGEQIPLESRVIAVADAYDAMTSDRPYRPAMRQDEAICEIRDNAGTQFDPLIARVFIEKVLNTRYEPAGSITDS